MRRSIPSRVCDRCGDPYKLFVEKGRRKADALRVTLKTDGPDGPIDMKAGFPDLCPKCGERVRDALMVLVLNSKLDEIDILKIASGGKSS